MRDYADSHYNDLGPDFFDPLDDPFYYDRFEEHEDTVPVDLSAHDGEDDLDEEEGSDDVSDYPNDGICYRLECWQSEGGRGRHRSKGMTLRSWRNPKSLGGSLSRKAVVRKMDRRRPIRHAIWGYWLPEPSAVG